MSGIFHVPYLRLDSENERVSIAGFPVKRRRTIGSAPRLEPNSAPCRTFPWVKCLSRRSAFARARERMGGAEDDVKTQLSLGGGPSSGRGAPFAGSRLPDSVLLR